MLASLHYLEAHGRLSDRTTRDASALVAQTALSDAHARLRSPLKSLPPRAVFLVLRSRGTPETRTRSGEGL